MTKSLNDSAQTARLFENFNLPEAPADDADLPPPEPTFTEAELSAVQAEAWNEGYLAGAQSSARTVGNDAQRVFTDLYARADDMDRRLESMSEHYAGSLARWLVQTFVTAFPGLSAQAMEGRIQCVADLLRPLLRAQTRIGVRDATGCAVWCDSMQDVWRHVRARQSEEPACGDIVITWPQGEARISNETNWQAIQAAIMPLLGNDSTADAVEDSDFQFTVGPVELTGHVG